MNKTFFLLLATVFSFQIKSLAQVTPDRGCATSEMNLLLEQQHPEFKTQRQQIEKQAQTYLETRRNSRSQNLTDTIPVVFHVIFNASAENITDAQLLSQLAVLNEDFNRRNGDATNAPAAFQAVAGNPQLYFCLARLDPYGKPTSGITRRATNKNAFQYSLNEMKFTDRGGHNAWNPELYLNIWVCNLSDNILGFAQFPGGAPETDGIVLKYSSIGRAPENPYPGPYNLGRTATHEIGHWLGLRHIWGEEEASCVDTDFINDTPNQSGKSSGCPQFPKLSCNNGPNGDMFMNFMDYTNDGCMNLFTHDQAAKMNAVLHTSRTSILTSNVCSNLINADFRAKPDAILPGQTTDFYYYSNGRRPTSFSWTFEGGVPGTSTDSIPRGIRYEKPGAYTVTLTVSDAFGTDTEIKPGYLKVTTSELQLYPNPANTMVTVGAPAGQKLQHIAIFNTIGQLVLESTATERTAQIPVNTLHKGLYLVTGETDSGNFLTQRLLIIH